VLINVSFLNSQWLVFSLQKGRLLPFWMLSHN